MITGFNTDVVHAGTTYHVQTEDKGTETPLILSLVYVGGAILASKRTSYKDLLDAGFDAEQLAERLQRQHKLICAAIKAGRIDDLKKMSEAGARETAPPETKPRAARAPKPPAADAPPKPSPAAEKSPAAPREREPFNAPRPAAPPVIDRSNTLPPAASAAPAPNSRVVAESKLELTTLDDPEFFYPVQSPAHPPTPAPEPTPPAPVPVAPTPAPPEVAKTFYIRLLDDEGDFRAGELVTIRVHVGRGPNGGVPVRNADVTIKVLGTTFRPLIVSTETDEQGVAVVRALLPRFTSGRAAILIRARSEGYEAEMRRIIKQA